MFRLMADYITSEEAKRCANYFAKSAAKILKQKEKPMATTTAKSTRVNLSKLRTAFSRFLPAMILSLSLIACGTDDSEKQDKTPAKLTSTKEKKRVQSTAYLSKLSLPRCDGDIENQIAYTKTEKKLWVCEDGSWGEVEIQAVDVVNSETGNQPDNIWIDPVTFKRYMISYRAHSSVDTCVDLVRKATYAEILSALQHGFILYISDRITPGQVVIAGDNYIWFGTNGVDSQTLQPLPEQGMNGNHICVLP